MSEYARTSEEVAANREIRRRIQEEHDQQVSTFAHQILLLLQNGEMARNQLLNQFFDQQGVNKIEDTIEKYEEQRALEPLFNDAVRLLLMGNRINLNHLIYSLVQE